MKNIDIKILWESFIKEYKIFLISNEEQWLVNLEKVKKYINENKKLPNKKDKNNEYRILYRWIINQKQNYKKERYIMKNIKFKDLWNNFIIEYKIFFISNEELWIETLNKVKKYINENKKKPSINDKNKYNKFLSEWISTQIDNYNKKIQIMKNPSIKKLWENFINENINLFIKNKSLKLKMI
jgi:hypothetical protein